MQLVLPAPAMMRQLACWIAVLALCLPIPVLATVTAIDDAGRTITLPAPARRIVSLAPHATELLYAAGAGPYLVGVIEYSDYPPEAKRIASVGSAAAFDIERIAALKPDLIVAWGSGNSAAKIAKLRGLGMPVFESEPRDFATIASSLERLARLAGTEPVGHAAAEAFRNRLKSIRATYRQRLPVRVFYQIWRSPLMTLNDAHMVSHAMALCGGENVFGKLPQLAPTVSIEAVLQENPEAIVAGNSSEDEALANWRRFPSILAVKRGNLFSIKSDLMTRAGPRVLDGTETLCRQLDVARSRRK